MFCVEVLGKDEHRIQLCEEAIQYSAYRHDGVELAATILLNPVSTEPVWLLHRRSLEEVTLASLERWNDDGESIPYSHLFANIAPKRAVLQGNAEVAIRPFCRKPLGVARDTVGAKLFVPDDGDGVGMEELFRHADNTDARDQRPFTCVKIGPFSEPGRLYLFRIDARVDGSGSTYSDLTDETPELATRAYQIYGPHWVRHQIEFCDLPAAMSSAFCESYREEENFFKEEIVGGKLKRLVPDFYSIVALDNRNSQPSRLTCVSLDEEAIHVITEWVSPQIYDHPFFADLPRGSIHWFVSDSQAKDFVLPLIGPMAPVIAPVTKRA